MSQSTDCRAQDKAAHPVPGNCHDTPPHPLRHLNAAEFAALGAGEVVFVRSITARDLSRFLPEAATMPAELHFLMVMGADGTLELVTDQQDAVDQWFAENERIVGVRH
ncbi:MAG TPA: DUF1150 family protein [Devosia sp.]|nr:DUF1150 family protein [Devosia sp.]